MAERPPRRDPLTVDRLRMVRELHRTGTIAGAARRLGLTPSAVSQQLSALERATGVGLIDRAGRRAALTPAGHALLAHAERVLAALEAAAADLDRARGEVRGPLRLATVPSAAATIVSPAMAALRADHPDLDLTVIDEEPHRSLEHLDRGDVDLAVVDLYDVAPLALGTELDVAELLDEPLLAVVPADHPLAARPADRAVPLVELADADWIVAPPEVSCGAAVRAACRAAGFEPRVRWQTDDLLLHLHHVGAGHGVALLPRLAVRLDVAAVAARPVSRPAVGRRLLTVARAAGVARPAVVATGEALRKAVADLPA